MATRTRRSSRLTRQDQEAEVEGVKPVIGTNSTALAARTRRSSQLTGQDQEAEVEEVKPVVGPKAKAQSKVPEVNEYEKEREAMIERNRAMLEALGVESALQEVEAKIAARRPKAQHKGIQSARKRPRESSEAFVARRSARVQGLAPSGGSIMHESRGTLSVDGAKVGELGSITEPWRGDRRIEGPVKMQSSNWDDESDAAFIESLKGWKEDQPLHKRHGGGSDTPYPDLASIHLREEDVGRVVKAGVYVCEFMPIADRVLVAAGGKDGAIGIWDVDSEPSTSGNDGVYPYKPHSRCISGLAFAQYDFTRMYSSSFDGSVRVMDVETAQFQEVFVMENGEFSSLCVAPESKEIVYVGDVDGAVMVVDGRAGKVMEAYNLHPRKVNTLQFNPANPNILASACIDTNACVWDVRKLPRGGTEANPKNVRSPASFSHSKAANSAYFSPDGKKLMTTSYDNYVRIWDGEDAVAGKVSKPMMMSHNNNTGRWISAFRAIWAPDSNQAIIGGMKRTLDVIAFDKEGVASSLSADSMSSIAARNAIHPLIPGVVAGGSAGGKVFLWRP